MLTREQWGARAPKGPGGKRTALTPAPITSRTEFVVHYDDATPVIINGLEQLKSRMRGMQVFHQGPERGWVDIGYNLLVASSTDPIINGLIVEGRGRDVVGAHCPNHNTTGIGVQVMIGGNQQPTPEALNAVRDLYDQACKDAGRKLTIMGHRDGYSTECPGQILYPWLLKGMPRPTTKTIPAPELDPWTRHARPEDDEWDILDTIQLTLCRLGKQTIPPCANLSLINALRSTWALPPVTEAVYGRDLVRKMQEWGGRLTVNGILSAETARRVTKVMNDQLTGKGL
ncbi:ABC transporter [Platysternon megacephalum]|uniref:ABC transporter n=1 Tax=Platysternon megacephalum TaxID=55544 RepID=A0A4D9DEN2_9SAUR|nr:ABC transporter [Platysternon megacephalum]